jgi:hypothetical protein
MNDVLNDGVSEREGEEKNETSAGRSCFGSENDGGMGCFCDWEEVKSAEQRCFGVGEQSPVFFSGVSALEK